MTGIYILIIAIILAIGFMIIILISSIVAGYKTLKRTRDAKKAEKCPYYIEGGLSNEKTESKSRTYNNIDSERTR